MWALTTVAILLALERVLARAWWPTFDNASIWLRTWDVGTEHTPLVGTYSRFGWYHPGPLLFYVLAPLLRLSGGLPSALQAGVLAIGLASALGLVVLVARRVGPGAALVLGIATGLLGMGYGERLLEPWNPYVGLLPFALFVVACWLVACGDAISLPIAAVAGTFAAQVHLGGAVPFVLLGVVAWLLDRVWPVAPRAAGAWKWHLLAPAILVVLWAPPLFEQLTGGGNLDRILEFVTSGKEPVVGLTQGLLMTGGQLLPWGPWLGNSPPIAFLQVPPAPAWALLASALPLGAALVLAVRLRDALGLRLVAVAAAGCLACVAATSQIRGTAPEYLTLWSRAVAMLNVSAPFVVLARRYASKLVVRRAGASVALAVAAAFAAVPISTRAWSARVPSPELSRAYEAIIPLALSEIPPGVSVRVAGAGVPFAASPHALIVALERAGRFGKTRTFHRLEVGEHRTAADNATLPTLLLVMGPDVGAPEPARRVVGSHDPLSREQRAEAIRLRGRLEQALRETKRTDLVGPLHLAAPWLAERAPPELNRAELERYLVLASGEDKIAWVLYASPPGPL